MRHCVGFSADKSITSLILDGHFEIPAPLQK
ncbi:hypothetical protein F383_29111 [Gossypium arboreum]|uniref:Uncharacterized protein n=1 Tax=Gossypium arboreum TaxID=29729 RepID=A0A0B0PJ22_GOSAR|nr:hypothetical protein F383_29111 [Gossypium arboreum]